MFMQDLKKFLINEFGPDVSLGNVAAIPDAAGDDWIVVHDAARPFASPALIARAIAAARKGYYPRSRYSEFRYYAGRKSREV